MDNELARKNVRLGLALLAVAILLFAGSIVAPEIYNALN